MAEDKKPPRAKKVAKELTIHGHTRIDNFYWLNQRKDPEVIGYLEAENEYVNSELASTEGLQKALYEEMVGRIKKDDESAPYRSNGYYYYSRYEKGSEYPIYARKKDSLDAPEEVLLNVNELAEGHDYYRVAGLSVSRNNKLLAFGVDTLSRRKYTIQFKDLVSGELLNEFIPNTSGRAEWANDNSTVFYLVKDSTLRPHMVYRHKLGSPQREDELVYHEKDNTFASYIRKAKSNDYIFIGSYSTLSSEVRFLDANTPFEDFSVLHPREKAMKYSVSHFGNKFYIVTNDNAKNFRLMEAPVSSPGKRHWKEVIPHRSDVLLQSIEVFRNFLVVSERKNGLTQLRVIDQRNGDEYYLPFEEEAYAAYISTNEEFDTSLLRYSYTSMTTPVSTYDYNMVIQERKLLKREEVVGGYDPSLYVTRRLYATASDGVKVPISLVHRKGLQPSGDNPLLLFGYGSYGTTMDASFRSTRLSLIDRGFVYAIAHIRGGQTMGRQWYEDGKMLNKKNTFTDFISCAEFLVSENYTNSDKLFALGGSAGGLLMGAVVNMRPELFRGVIAAVPFVDVVTTMLDETIPLTTREFNEWGNPKEKEYYDYILSYSPYDNVEAKAYPAMLVTTGLHDSQVQYWEPAKWVAKLRELKTDTNPLYLRTQMEFGHSGASGRFERLKETALQFAFILDLLGATDEKQRLQSAL